MVNKHNNTTMPAVYGARLTTFEDSEKESEYGYVRKTYGAICLDGSPPAYHRDKGFGAGINNWLVHIEGGGWCNNVTLCLNHSETCLGSSKHMDKAVNFTGILSRVQNYNPDFYNWNRIKIRYCDGASFIGDVEAINPVTLRSGSWTIRRS